MPIPNWSNLEAVRRLLAKAEANAQAAMLKAKKAGAVDEAEELSPVQLEVMAYITSIYQRLADAAEKVGVPLECLGNRPLNDKNYADFVAESGGEEFAQMRLKNELSGLDPGGLDGLEICLMSHAFGDMDRDTGVYCGHPWPDWIEAVVRPSIERQHREFARHNAGRQTPYRD
jgi:hypothetical protein